MTAHRPKALTITPELVRMFARYLCKCPAWGICHVSLDDGNYDCIVSDLIAAPHRDERYFHHPEWRIEDAEIARLHDLLTPSQRARLGRRAEAEARRIEREQPELYRALLHERM